MLDLQEKIYDKNKVFLSSRELSNLLPFLGVENYDKILEKYKSTEYPPELLKSMYNIVKEIGEEFWYKNSFELIKQIGELKHKKTAKWIEFEGCFEKESEETDNVPFKMIFYLSIYTKDKEKKRMAYVISNSTLSIKTKDNIRVYVKKYDNKICEETFRFIVDVVNSLEFFTK